MSATAGRDDAREAARRQARLSEVFGNVMPETTADERDPESSRDAAGDSWLREQVPPHHGG